MTPITAVYFQNLPEVLIRHLSDARSIIRIAVCWFSHKGIFEVLLARLREGVRVELVLEYDTQNIRADGLDFQQFIHSSGHFYAHLDPGLMHHKFALVDDRLLLSGSFNWTYNSNAENLIATNDESIVQKFLEEFERRRSLAKRVLTIKQEEAKNFSSYALFENTHFHLPGLRKKVSGGAGIWLIRLGKRKLEKDRIFRESRLPFDRTGLLNHYWNTRRMWDEVWFDEELGRLRAVSSPLVIHNLRLWAHRIKTGDLVLATVGKNRLLGLGIVQSGPQRSHDAAFSSFRDVQWLKVFDNEPYTMKEKISAQGVARFRGSGLRLLQEVFESR
ncbi:MAG: hypothetical protein IPJ82_08330 [Lewinellaceae bacterium]|nr:hypothetical protein [Lewinellaceae bacterium]